jgi:hypothetical protein
MLGSPLLGPSVWRPVAHCLNRLGWPVTVPPAPDAAPRTPDDVLRHLVSALPSDRDLVLVPHSNAGVYVPELVAACRIVAFVFVDARLPAAAGAVPLGSADIVDQLGRMADRDGLLPPWTQWWDPADVAALFPDQATQDLIEREQFRLPLAYFEQVLPDRPGWDRRPGAYLAFGDTYATERADASRRGWPVATLPGEHLHMLMRPDEVATALDALLTSIGRRPGDG